MSNLKIFEILKRYFNNKKSKIDINIKNSLLNDIISFNFNEDNLLTLKKFISDQEFKNELLNEYQVFLSKIEKKEKSSPDVTINKFIYEIVNLYDKELLKHLFQIISTHNMGLFYISKILNGIAKEEKIETILEIICELDFKIIKNINYFETIYLNNIFNIEKISIDSDFKEVLNKLFYFLIYPFFSENSDIREEIKEKFIFYSNKLRDLCFSTIREKIILSLEELKINKKSTFTSLLELCYYDTIIFSESDQLLRDIIVKINEKKEDDEEAYFKFICEEFDIFLNFSYKKYSTKISANFDNILELSKYIFKESDNQDTIDLIFENIDPFIQNIIQKIFNSLLSLSTFFDLDDKKERILKLLIERKNILKENVDNENINPLNDCNEVYNPDEIVNLEIEDIKIQSFNNKQENNIKNESKNENKEKKEENYKLNDSLYKLVIEIFDELKNTFDLNNEEDIKKIDIKIVDIVSEKNSKLHKKLIIEKAINDSLTEEDFESL